MPKHCCNSLGRGTPTLVRSARMPRKHSITHPCETCGKPVQTDPWRVARGWGRFCSRSCKRGRPLVERFWAKVQKTDTCWLWTGATARHGYGNFFDGNHWVPAHRLAFELTYGPIHEGLDICHRCDNPPCVRPDHLFPGTTRENLQDASRKGRTATGDRNGSRTHPERFIGRRNGSRETGN